MDINSLASEFGSGSKSNQSATIDDPIHALANEFGSKEKKKEIKRIYVSPAPPISGATKEQSDIRNTEIQKTPTYKGGPQTGPILPPTDIVGSVARNFQGGKELAGEGLNDISTGKPYRGFIKAAGGTALMGLSPVSGLVEGAVERPITEITGNPDIGSRAGFVISSALPIKTGVNAVNKVAGAIPVINKLSTYPSNKAFNTLLESIGGSENAGKIAAEMRANPRLTPADLSPATKQTLQKLFVTEGDKTKNYLAETVQGRLQSAKTAVEDAFDTAMGKAVDPADKLKQLSDNIKSVGAKEINPVLKNTKPVDLTPVVEHIDNVLKPGVTHVISNPESMLPYDKVQKLLESWRTQLTNDKTVLTSPDVLNKIQSNMRRQAEGLMRTPDAESKAMGYALYQVRNKIIDAIDKSGQNPGAYRKALTKYKDENDIASAFEHGHDAIIKNSRNLEDHPSFFKNWVNQASEGEKEAAREGARVAIETQINAYKSAARRGTDIGQSEFNQQRIEALFGKEEAQKLFKKLEHERMIAETNSDLIRGSQTAMRQTADSRIALPVKTDIMQSAPVLAAAEGINYFAGGVPGMAATLVAGVKGANMAKHAIATKLAKEHNANFAKLALPIEGPQREELIRSLEAVANQQKPTMLSRAASAARLFGP